MLYQSTEVNNLCNDVSLQTKHKNFQYLPTENRQDTLLIQSFEQISLGLSDLRWLWACLLFLCKISPTQSKVSLGQDDCSLGKTIGIGSLGGVCVQCKARGRTHTHTYTPATDCYFAANFAHQQLPTEQVFGREVWMLLVKTRCLSYKELSLAMSAFSRNMD